MTLRSRLAIATGGIAFVAVGTLAAGAYVIASHELRSQVDASLSARETLGSTLMVATIGVFNTVEMSVGVRALPVSSSTMMPSLRKYPWLILLLALRSAK